MQIIPIMNYRGGVYYGLSPAKQNSQLKLEDFRPLTYNVKKSIELKCTGYSACEVKCEDFCLLK